MGGGHSNTHVANATGNYLRIYYQVEHMRLEELVVEVKVEGGYSPGGPSANIGGSTKLVFRHDTRVRYLRLPPGEYCNFSGDGELFASVFVEHQEDPQHCIKDICSNFHVPSDRSFIVTASENIKFQMYGGNVWVDEDGINHKTIKP